MPAERDVVREELVRRPYVRLRRPEREEPGEREGLSVEAVRLQVGVPGDHADRLVGERAQQVCEPARFRHDVAVEEHEQVALDLACARVLQLVVLAARDRHQPVPQCRRISRHLARDPVRHRGLVDLLGVEAHEQLDRPDREALRDDSLGLVDELLEHPAAAVGFGQEDVLPFDDDRDGGGLHGAAGYQGARTSPQRTARPVCCGAMKITHENLMVFEKER